jgi:hypothetical protein
MSKITGLNKENLIANRKKLEIYLKKNAVITIHAEEDESAVRGNLIASGNDVTDAKDEDTVIRRLVSGDVWAWASVEVKASIGEFNASVYLRQCSYKNERDFKSGDYYTDMIDDAISELANRIELAKGAADQILTEAGV